MSLKDRLRDDMKGAMKAKDAPTLSAIRMLNSAIKNKEIELRRELDDAEVDAVVAADVKKRRDSIEQFKAGGRDDLVAEETAQLASLEKYLPEQMDEAQVRALVADAVAGAGATSPKEMGNVMKILMPKVKGKADGGLVNRIVREALGG